MRGISAKSKFTLIVITAALLAVLVLGAIAWYEARLSLRAAEFTHLTSVRTNKARQIENYFESVNDQLVVLAEDHMIIAAMVQLSRGFNSIEEIDVPVSYNRSIETYYVDEFLPRLEANISSGVPEYSLFQPETQPGRYLQYHYISENGNAVGFKQFLDDAEDGSDYSQFHAQYHRNFRELLLRFGYYDLFLIDFDTGDIVYTVFKEVDYGTNLLTGPYRNSGLAKVVQQVMRDPIRQQTQIVDFEPYAPSYNAPAAFVAAPIFNGDHIVGILALQLPVDQIDAIMTGEESWFDEGLGESGETYLVGSDRLMRSNSRFIVEDKESYLSLIRSLGTNEEVVNLIDTLDTSILLQQINTEGVQRSLAGETDTRIILDYRGIPVLSSFSPLNIQGLDWVILSEINEQEAFAPVQRLLSNMILAAVILIGLMAMASIWLGQNFMAPVREIVAAAGQIRDRYASGQINNVEQLDLETIRSGEFAELSETMNQIIGHVNRLNIDAEHKQQEYARMLALSMPESVAERYANGERRIIDHAAQATTIFILVRGFHKLKIELDDVDEALSLYHELESLLQDAASEFGVDLFDQLGSEFIGVCGLTTPYLNHIERVVEFSKSAIRMVVSFNIKNKTKLTFQIGIDMGQMMGGLVSTHNASYGVWGETVYIAQETGYVSDENRIAVTKPIQEYLLDHADYQLTELEDKIRIFGVEQSVWEMRFVESEPEMENVPFVVK